MQGELAENFVGFLWEENRQTTNIPAREWDRKGKGINVAAASASEEVKKVKKGKKKMIMITMQN